MEHYNDFGFNFSYEEQQRWESTMARDKFPTSDERSSFHLYFYPNEINEKWEAISELTRENRLGYMSSISPDPMQGGRYYGAFTVSIHTDEAEAETVKRAIEAAGLDRHIFNRTLVKACREWTD